MHSDLYLDFYRLTPAEARPGTRLSDLIDRIIRNGAIPSGHSAEELMTAARERIAKQDR